jgi:alkanesulfonate monooxygenase SsuD/methylene tetrahydromethanopterin reductase-like flavin-dependent oxidoreductase (luciferase family)
VSDYGHDLLFGSFVTPTAQQPQQAVLLAQASEQAGLDLVTFQDHPYQPAFLDTWTLMSYAAARTSRIRLSANVVNLPLRPPAVLARAVASLDLLSDGRVDLALGAGAFWDAIEAMGGERLSPGEAVESLEEAIAVIRALWDTETRGGVRVEGRHHRVVGAKRGPAPAHDVPIWVGALKPRMLRLVGRRADGWLPSLAYLGGVEAIGRGNAVIDEAALAAGRQPADVRRLLNIGPRELEPELLAELALAYGVSAFIVAGDDPRLLQHLGQEVAPEVRELVEAERLGVEPAPTSATAEGTARSAGSRENPENAGESAVGATPETARLGVEATPDPGTRLSAGMPWDESARPSAPEVPGAAYTDRGRQVSRHLVDVHDALRAELAKVRDIVDQVVEGARDIGSARSEINRMSLRQNDWTLGGYCQAYCRVVTQHHTLEDEGIFPHLRGSEPSLAPVVDRLVQEHHAIHEVLEGVDRALVDLVGRPGDHAPLRAAVDLMTDTLLSHFSYEERELLGPLARHGMYAGQL